jgi:hypothetical protein
MPPTPATNAQSFTELVGRLSAPVAMMALFVWLCCGRPTSCLKQSTSAKKRAAHAKRIVELKEKLDDDDDDDDTVQKEQLTVWCCLPAPCCEWAIARLCGTVGVFAAATRCACRCIKCGVYAFIAAALAGAIIRFVQMDNALKQRGINVQTEDAVASMQRLYAEHLAAKQL